MRIDEHGKYRIRLEGEWTLEDLYVFPRAFEQLYFLLYSLLPNDDPSEVERIEYAFRAFPWQGGYSAVNFYNQLKFTTPRQQRPRVMSIRYESPGWIELGLIIGVALTLERIVKSLTNSIGDVHRVYNDIMKGMFERKLLRFDVKRGELQLRKEEQEYIDYSLARMAKMLGLESIAEINARTGNPYISLKILLSMYRRIRTLVDYQSHGKAGFDRHED